MVRLGPTNTTTQRSEVNTNVYFGAHKLHMLIDTNEYSECEYCGKGNELSARNCEFCGAPLRRG